MFEWKTEEMKKAEKEMMLRKLRFMGRVTAERVASTGTIDYDRISIDAQNVLAADDVIENPM